MSTMRIPRPRLPLTPRSSHPPRRSITTKPPPFPTTPHCPPSTCSCAPTPLRDDIDHTSPLNGAITSYNEQILICTGKDDWTSRIEDDNEGKNLAAKLKENFFGRGGEMQDPFYNVSVLNTSFRASTPQGGGEATSVYLLPSFKYVPCLRPQNNADIKAMLKGWVLPKTLNPMYEKTPEMKPKEPEKLLRDETYRAQLPDVRDVDEILVLVCGHGGRDERCGVFGPLLKTEFEDKLSTVGCLTVHQQPKETAPDVNTAQEDQPVTSARVGLVSHIGGHKFAGNVILYIPPGMKLEDGSKHPLAGMGVWYGRVEPKHVEGIVRETVGRGRVIEEFFRGAIDGERRILRLDDGGGLTRGKKS